MDTRCTDSVHLVSPACPVQSTEPRSQPAPAGSMTRWGGGKGLLAPPMPTAVLRTQGVPHEGWIISASFCLVVVFRRSLPQQEWPISSGLGRKDGRTQSRVPDVLVSPAEGALQGWSANARYWGQRQRRSLARRSLNDQSREKDKYVCSSASTWGWFAWYNRGSSLTMTHRTPGCVITVSPSSALQREGKWDIRSEFSGLFCFS